MKVSLPVHVLVQPEKLNDRQNDTICRRWSSYNRQCLETNNNFKQNNILIIVVDLAVGQRSLNNYIDPTMF